jgi:hypothetical protein
VRIAGLLLLLAALGPRLAWAQGNGYQTAIRAAAALRPASPAPAAEIFRPVNTDFTVARRFSSRAPGATMMIIGGAAIVAGILVGGSGGTVLIVGGIGVGAYGFYLYSQ